MQRFWPTIRLIFVVNLVYFKVLADGLFTYLMRKSKVARQTLLKKKKYCHYQGKKMCSCTVANNKGIFQLARHRKNDGIFRPARHRKNDGIFQLGRHRKNDGIFRPARHRINDGIFQAPWPISKLSITAVITEQTVTVHVLTYLAVSLIT